MNKHTKKIIAPVIIAGFLIVYAAAYCAILLFIDDLPLVARVLGAAVPAGVAGVSFFVLKERIEEIRSGEEDDISKY